MDSCEFVHLNVAQLTRYRKRSANTALVGPAQGKSHRVAKVVKDVRSPSQKIFVVDDDRSVRVSLDRLLRTADLESTGFGSAEEFLAYLEQGDQAAVTGCVILDLQLPR